MIKPLLFCNDLRKDDPLMIFTSLHQMKNEILENGENNDAESNFPGTIKDEPVDEDAKESNISKSDGEKISNRLGFNER